MHPETKSMVEHFHGALKKFQKPTYTYMMMNETRPFIIYYLLIVKCLWLNIVMGLGLFEIIYGRYLEGPLSILYNP